MRQTYVLIAKARALLACTVSGAVSLYCLLLASAFSLFTGGHLKLQRKRQQCKGTLNIFNRWKNLQLQDARHASEGRPEN
jgi:hypothetical protein